MATVVVDTHQRVKPVLRYVRPHHRGVDHLMSNGFADLRQNAARETSAALFAFLWVVVLSSVHALWRDELAPVTAMARLSARAPTRPFLLRR